MPTVSFSPLVNSSPDTLVSLFDTIGVATVINATATEIDLAFGTAQISVLGTGFTFSGGLPTGGTVTGLIGGHSGAMEVSISGLSIGLPLLYQTIHDDVTGLHPSGIEDMFLPLGWKYTGNGNADILPKGAVSADGVPLNLSGKDVFVLNGGADSIFLGDGNDKGYGGSGKDTLDGGFGADSLFGSAGADRLIGGAGGDKLDGGGGDDSLFGGGGKDTFVFNQHDGSDRITEFSVHDDVIDLAPGVDHSFTGSAAGAVLHYGSFGDQVLLVNVDLAHAALITFI